MNRTQLAGLAITGIGSAICIIWVLWKGIQLLEIPDILKIALILVIGGLIILIASLIVERSQDVKKETYLK